jgi:hypothetical protein
MVFGVVAIYYDCGQCRLLYGNVQDGVSWTDVKKDIHIQNNLLI